jgi:hypothetical protein
LKLGDAGIERNYRSPLNGWKMFVNGEFLQKETPPVDVGSARYIALRTDHRFDIEPTIRTGAF